MLNLLAGTKVRNVESKKAFFDILEPRIMATFELFNKKIWLMNTTEKHIVKTYSGLFEGLSAIGKLELIENLTKSLKAEKNKKEKDFYKSFGAFGSDKPAKEIVEEIKASRKFRGKDLKL
jgi:hypothetical protein